MSERNNIFDEVKNIHDGDAWHGPALNENLKSMTPEQAAARPLPKADEPWR